ncbi:MAG: 30S ribosomal protein S20 [Anaerolineales bacterium]|nr:30S ribosomal protein S20 [Anaerolineales bacterium]
MGLKSSQKRDRQNVKRRARNRTYRGRARSMVKDVREAIEENDLEAAREKAAEAMKALDKAAAKGAIHKNNAARRKSRIAKQLASLEESA